MYSVKRMIAALMCICIVWSLTGCMAIEDIPLEYDNMSLTYGLVSEELQVLSADYMAEDLCVAEGDVNDEEESSYTALSAAVFDITGKEVVFADNIFERLYPASTTKIMTAIVAMKYGNLEEIVTVSSNALNLEAGSSVCNLKAGDRLSLEQCLYGLITKSGNDAANAIAEHISGSNENFCELMNREAKEIGAIDTHFVNPSGLHDENHYTTAYDLYIMFHEAMKYDVFMDMLKVKSYSTSYTNAAGERINANWETTNQYLTGVTDEPETITVIGGKTGTTLAAGSCLILLSENAAGEQNVSIVMKSNTRTTLYEEMTDLLLKTVK